MKKGKIMIILVLGGLLVVSSGQIHQIEGQNDPKQSVVSLHAITAYEIQEPITIWNDSAFEKYDFDGSGEPDDPYQITGYNITNPTPYLIHIENTTALFSINNCYLNGTNTASMGLYLKNVTYGTIENNIICNTTNSGIWVRDSSTNTLSTNTIYYCANGIELSSSNTNTLSSNTIHDCGSVGIGLDISCNNNNLTGNTIYDCTDFGIVLDTSCNNNTLTGNTIHDCYNEAGIVLWESSNNTIVSNTIYDCAYGIVLDSDCINNTLSDNTIYNITEDGIILWDFSNNNTLSANTIYSCNSYGIGLVGSSNNTLSINRIYNCSSDGIRLFSSSNNNTLSTNTIYNCSIYGIYLYSFCNNNSLSVNIVYNSRWGIFLDDNCNNDTLTGNTIYNCSDDGIILAEYANNNTITYNNVYNNTDYGFYIDGGSHNNTVNWNNFVKNNVNTGFNQSHDAGITNNVSYNYWEDHTSPDNPPDGIVDTPYNIEGGSNQDPFPLTTPVLPTVTIDSPVEQEYGVETITVRLAGRLSIYYQYYIEGVDGENRTWTASEERMLTDGVYTLHAYGSDILGNTVHNSVMFTIDTTSPIITLSSPTNATVQPSGTTIDVAVTDALLHTVLYHWDGTSNQTWSGEYKTTLPTEETQHVLYVYANDSFDRWASGVFVFTTDDTSPTITLDSPTNDTTHPAGTLINLTVTDLHLETVLYNWDDSSNQTLHSPYNVTLPTESGQHVLRVYAKDKAGHWTAKTYVFTTRRPVDLGPLLGVSAIGVSVAALAGGGYFFLKKKGINIRDLLGREPPEPPDSSAPPEE